MKNNRRKFFGFAIVGIATLIIGTLFVFAQGGREGWKGRHHGAVFGQGGFPPQFLVDRIAAESGLSDEQKTQAKQIMDESKTRIEPLFATMKQNHEAIKNLGTDGNFEEAKVNKMANQQAETMKQLFIEKEKTKAQLFALLTPEQREKAKTMQEKSGERMRHGFGRGHKKDGKSEE